MNGAVVVKSGRLCVIHRLFVHGLRRRGLERCCFDRVFCIRHLFRNRWIVFPGPQPAGGVRRLTRSGVGFLAPLRRYSRLFVFVIGIARRAPGLLHLVINHRHNGVIGDAALARAIVVQNVTEPKPALLHQWYVLQHRTAAPCPRPRHRMWPVYFVRPQLRRSTKIPRSNVL
jgi:hypothetical protein